MQERRQIVNTKYAVIAQGFPGKKCLGTLEINDDHRIWRKLLLSLVLDLHKSTGLHSDIRAFQ